MNLQYLLGLNFNHMEIISRLTSKTPRFWAKVRNLALSIFAGATSVWIVNSEMGLDLNEWILGACKYLIAIGAAVGFTAQMTKEDNGNAEK